MIFSLFVERTQNRLTILIYLKACDLQSYSWHEVLFSQVCATLPFYLLILWFRSPVFIFRSFDPRRECNLRKYSYLLPAEVIGIKSSFTTAEVDYHLSDFNNILNAFEVWYLSFLSFSPLLIFLCLWSEFLLTPNWVVLL